jgi:hypothetical protein
VSGGSSNTVLKHRKTAVVMKKVAGGPILGLFCHGSQGCAAIKFIMLNQWVNDFLDHGSSRGGIMCR